MSNLGTVPKERESVSQHKYGANVCRWSNSCFSKTSCSKYQEKTTHLIECQKPADQAIQRFTQTTHLSPKKEQTISTTSSCHLLDFGIRAIAPQLWTRNFNTRISVTMLPNQVATKTQNQTPNSKRTTAPFHHIRALIQLAQVLTHSKRNLTHLFKYGSTNVHARRLFMAFNTSLIPEVAGSTDPGRPS